MPLPEYQRLLGSWFCTTTASTFALQTLGLPAVAEGNVILLNDVRLGVVEACSGLRMLVIFFALSTAVALLMRRPLWEMTGMIAWNVGTATYHRSLIHGTILHGTQYPGPALERRPTSYYTETSGIGRALESMHPSLRPLKVRSLSFHNR